MRHDDLRPKGADGVGDPLAKGERWLDLAVGLVEEVDARDAQLRGERALLGLAQARESADVRVGVVASLVAAGDHQVAHLGTLGCPARHGAGGPELDVVGMRGHHEDAVRGGQLVVWHRVGRS